MFEYVRPHDANSAQRISFDTPPHMHQRSLETSPHESLEFPTNLLSMTSGSGRAGSESNPLSLSGELNLTSLSSDSGVHTGKASEMSNSGDVDMVGIGSGSGLASSAASKCDSFGSAGDVAAAVAQGHSVAAAATATAATATDNGGNDADVGGGAKLSRTNSVRARANMFAAMEKKRLDETPPTASKTEERPPPTRKCEYTIF